MQDIFYLFLIIFKVFFKAKPRLFNFFSIFFADIAPMPRFKSNFGYILFAFWIAKNISEMLSVFAKPDIIRTVFKIRCGGSSVMHIDAKSALMFALSRTRGVASGEFFCFFAAVTHFFIVICGAFKKIFLHVIASVSAGYGNGGSISTEVFFHSADKCFKCHGSFFCYSLSRSAVGTC